MDFLRQIANSYYSKYGAEIENFWFVFPNKRSGIFFLNHLRKVLPPGKALLQPMVTTLGEMAMQLTGYIQDNRIDLLMVLYKCYLKVLKKGQKPKTFDDFWPWGEVAISDFNEIDLNLADAKALFTNVKDLQEISTDFLDENQKEVLSSYFGVDFGKHHAERFWNTFEKEPSKGKIDIREKFRTLWEMFYPLYVMFREKLDKKKTVYPGMAYRKLCEIFQLRLDEELPLVPGTKRVVAVGFDTLTMSEIKIFSLLRDSGMGDFIWDFTGPVKIKGNPQLAFMANNVDRFPKPKWLDLGDSDKAVLPKVTVITSPSNLAQAKITGKILQEIREKKSVESRSIQNARIGVVVPDEHILIPLLYSIPPQMPVNLSMGYPLRETGAIALVNLLRCLHLRKKEVGGIQKYFHEDVSALLSQPLVRILLGNDNCASLLSGISRSKKYLLSDDEILGFLPENEFMTLIFRKFSSAATASQYADYVRGILSAIQSRVKEENPSNESHVLEAMHLQLYLDALTILQDAIEEYKVEVSFPTMAILADKLISSEKINFEGDNLRGVQMMGVLETRNIDFDYLIMPSMQENVFPRKFNPRTFIPDSLRYAYGLPASQDKEKVYTYFFYRMISRAKEAYFIYDARMGGNKSGDISRFLLQLKHLYQTVGSGEDNEGFRITWKDCEFTLNETKHESISVKKEGVKDKLLSLTKEGGLNISASDFLKYLQCPLKFYYCKLQGIADESEPTEYMDPSTQGTIMHAVMEKAYLGSGNDHKLLSHPVQVTAETIKNLLRNDAAAVKKLVRTEINRTYLHKKGDEINDPLTGESEMVAQGMLYTIRLFLEHDLQKAPFTVLGCEVANDRVPDPENPEKTKKVYLRLPIPATERHPGEMLINFAYSIDRVDKVTEDGNDIVRVIDYKTGKAHKDTQGLDEMFEFKGKDIVQLMLYSMILAHLQGKDPKDYGIGIYSPQTLKEKGKEYPAIKGGSLRKVSDIIDLRGEDEKDFMEMLREKFEDLLDCSEGTVFTGCNNATACKSCNFRRLCGL